jgi:hypothetical protein
VALAGLGSVAWVFVAIVPAAAAVRHVAPSAAGLQSRSVVRGSRGRVRLLAAQSALAVSVVVVAGGALQAFDRLTRIDVGFSTLDVIAVDVSVPGWKYDSAADLARLSDRLLTSLQGLPRVAAAAGVSVRPFRFGEIADGLPVRRPEDTATSVDDAVAASRVVVTPDYFAAMGIGILDGRSFAEVDRAPSSPPVVVISRNLARTLWGDEHVVGRQVQSYSLSRGWQSQLIVGVADGVRSRVIERPSLELYVPDGRGELPLSLSSYVIRAVPGSITEAMIRQSLHAVEPDLAVERVQTTAAIVGAVTAPARLLATLMTLLGLTTLLLLALGIFGAAATALGASRREVAVRQALGATPLEASAAPLRALIQAVAVGTGTGVLAAPAILGSLTVIGHEGAAGALTPVTAGSLAVIISAAAAIWPSLRKTSRLPPAALLRES